MYFTSWKSQSAMLMESSNWARIALGLTPATRRASWGRTASWRTYFMVCIECQFRRW